MSHNRLQQAVPMSVLLSCCILYAGMPSSEDAEHVMLCLDDEIAGLVEAADVPADQHGAHSSDAVSPVPGGIAALHSMCAAALLHKNGCVQRLQVCTAVLLHAALICFVMP